MSPFCVPDVPVVTVTLVVANAFAKSVALMIELSPVAAKPLASVALIARHREQARVYFEALVAAEVPGLRLVVDQDFSFRPGIDVTDVKQTKGLEFDIVILLEANAQSYPENEHARRLLHVAMTRAAHQLWVTYTGEPSPLLPIALRR